MNVGLPDPAALTPPPFLKLLANDIRWALLKALAVEDLQVNELVTRLAQPMNLVSYHLKKMRDDALVTTRRSEADGRDIYYSLDLERTRQLFLEVGSAIHPSLGDTQPTQRLAFQRVLFVCTHNSARSQMAEGWLRHLTGGVLHIASAGSHPTRVHPEAIRAMLTLGVDIRTHQSHHLNDVIDQTFDHVITVCDKAREICPSFHGTGVQLHWGYPDPAMIQDAAARVAAFDHIARRLQTRIRFFISTLSSALEESDR